MIALSQMLELIRQFDSVVSREAVGTVFEANANFFADGELSGSELFAAIYETTI